MSDEITRKAAFASAVRAALTGQIDERIGLAWKVYGKQIAEPAPAPVVGDLRERLAEAIYNSEWTSGPPEAPWSSIEGIDRNEYLAQADGALSVIGPELAAKDAEIEHVGENFARAAGTASRMINERDEARAGRKRSRGATRQAMRERDAALADVATWSQAAQAAGDVCRQVEAERDALITTANRLLDEREQAEDKVSLEDLVMPADPFEAAKRAYYAWSRSSAVGTDIEIEPWENHCRIYPALGEAWVAVAVAVLEGVPLPAPTEPKPSRRTLTVSWAPEAIQRAIDHAKEILDTTEPNSRIAWPSLSWMDLACLLDAARAIHEEPAVTNLKAAPKPAVPVQAEPRTWNVGEPDPGDAKKVRAHNGVVFSSCGLGDKPWFATYESGGDGRWYSWWDLVNPNTGPTPLTEVVEQAPAGQESAR